jgi:hypothetical protein
MILRPYRRFLAVLAALLALGVVFGAGPAGAHAGGRAELYLADFRLEPAQPAGWTVQAVVSDRDSGKPLPGFDVKVTGTSPSGSVFGPVALADPGARGRYTATITPPAGQWALTVDARGFPGGAEGIPLTKTIEVHLDPGVAAHALTSGGRVHSGSGASRAWMVPSMLAVLVGGVAAASRRRSVGVSR